MFSVCPMRTRLGRLFLGATFSIAFVPNTCCTSFTQEINTLNIAFGATVYIKLLGALVSKVLYLAPLLLVQISIQNTIPLKRNTSGKKGGQLNSSNVLRPSCFIVHLSTQVPVQMKSNLIMGNVSSQC